MSGENIRNVTTNLAEIQEDSANPSSVLKHISGSPGRNHRSRIPLPVGSSIKSRKEGGEAGHPRISARSGGWVTQRRGKEYSAPSIL